MERDDEQKKKEKKKTRGQKRDSSSETVQREGSCKRRKNKTSVGIDLISSRSHTHT